MLRNGNLKIYGTLRSCTVINPSLGVTLRHVLKRIGEVRSLIPPAVRVMALTATATRRDRLSVSCSINKVKEPIHSHEVPNKAKSDLFSGVI